jgi:hypothetical protein
MPHSHRWAVAVFIALLAVLAAVAPTVDAIVFGVHDHVATGAAGGGQVLAGPADAGPITTHHCELSTNPAARRPDCFFAEPALGAWTLTEPNLPSVHDVPFAPSAPPRA